MQTRAPALVPLFGAAFVIAVENAGAGHLLPALAEATQARARGVSWFIAAYMLGTLLGAPLLAQLAVRVGRPRVLAASLFAFAAASMMVGLASNATTANAGRFAQGVASSPIMPLAAAHIGETVASARRGRALGQLSLAYAAGFVAGVAFVSLFLLLSFRIAFVFNAAMSLVAAVAVLRSGGASQSTPHTRPPPTPFSLPGAAAWLVTLVVLFLALSYARDEGALSFTRYLALPVLVVFLVCDGRAKAPLFPRDLFITRTGVALVCFSLVAGLGQACVVVLPSCAMTALGVSAAASGPLLAPIIVGGLGANVLVAARLDRYGATPFLLCGGLLTVAGPLVVARWGERFIPFEVGTLFLGAGVSLVSSGALRYLAAQSHGESDARQAAVSLLTNVGVLVGGALWGAAAGVSESPLAAIRSGLSTLALIVAPLCAACLLLRTPAGAQRIAR